MKILDTKISNGKKLFLIEDTPIKAEAGVNANPYYVPIQGINSSDNLKTKLLPKKELTKEEIIQLKKSPTAAKNIAIKEEKAKAQRLDASQKAYQKRIETGIQSSQDLADETGAIGDKISLQNLPYVGKYIPDMLDATGMIGNMASGLGRVPLNLEQRNYGQVALSVATPLTVGALAGIGTQNTGQFVNNIVNPLAGVKNPFSKSAKFSSTPEFINSIKSNMSTEEATKYIQSLPDYYQSWNSLGHGFMGNTPIEKVAYMIKNNIKSPVPEYIYHGTSSANLESILNNGLNSSLGKETNRGIIASSNTPGFLGVGNIEDATAFAHGAADVSSSKPVIFRLKNDKGLTTNFNGVVTHPPINSGYEYSLDMGKNWIKKISDSNFKSAMGNNGMFDMTNPNIYKTIVGGLATGALGKEAMKKQEFGGKIKILKTKISNGKTLHLIED